MKLRTTLLLSMMALLAGVLGLTSLAVVHVIGRHARQSVQEEVARGVYFMKEVLQARQGLLRNEVSVMAGEPRLRAVVATKEVDHATVFGVLSEIAEAGHSAVLLLTDEEGMLRADIAEPDAEGHDLSDVPIVRAALDGGDAPALWVDEDHVFQVHAQRIAFGEHVVGVLVLGRAIDDAVMARLARQTGTWNALTVDAGLVARGGGEELASAAGLAAIVSQVPKTQAPIELALRAGQMMSMSVGVPGYEGEANVRFTVFDSLDAALAPSRELTKLVGMLAAGSLLVALIFAFLLARGLSRPVDELGQLATELAGGHLEARVQPSGPTEVRHLGASMNGMATRLQASAAELEEVNQGLERTVGERTAELQSRNVAMKTILDNAGQAFLTLDAEGNVAPERSAIIERWFEGLGVDGKLWELTMPFDATVSEMLELSWESLSDGWLPIDMCIDQLPRQFSVEGRVLSIAYKPVMAEGDERLVNMVVVITDITAELERERLESEQKELLDVFLKLMSTPDAVCAFLDETASIVHRVKTSETGRVESVMRDIHTIKGNCSLFGLHTVAHVCHEVESRIAENNDEVEARDLKEVVAAFTAMEERIAPVVSDAKTEDILLGLEEYRRFEARLRACEGTYALIDEVLSWRHEQAHYRLLSLGEQAKDLANRRSKPGLNVVVDADGVRLDKNRWAPFWSCLSHVIRNAVDHGIESPAERTAAGKAPGGTLTLRAEQSEREVVISIADNGGGVHWEALAAKGATLGKPSETDADRVELLFTDGLSSKDEADELSGRGVGMAAVRSIVLELGGAIQVDSERGAGTTFRFCFQKGMPMHGLVVNDVSASKSA